MVIAVVPLFVTAQDDNDPEKALKKASKSLSSYNMDPQNSAGKLDEAKKAIEIACASDVTKGQYKTWYTRGQIYNELANKDAAMRMIKQDAPAAYPEAGYEAYVSYKKALELVQKGYEKKDAVKGMGESVNALRNGGSDMFNAKKMKEAYQSFSAVVNVQSILKENKEKEGVLPDSTINLYGYYAAVTANQAGMEKEAKEMYLMLYKNKYKEAGVYEGLYNLTYKTDEAEAIKYLEEGRKLFPDETSILFAEINHYLRNNKLDQLTGKLKQAIQKEPNNISLYNTLGNVYDNLAQIAQDSLKDAAKSAEYSKEAISYYEQALAKQPNNADANYSMGAYYYNKAALKTKEMQKLQDDMSKAGMAKYKDLEKEMNELFTKALPYFKKAESNNPNDENTLIALKEIFAKLDNVELYKEFKTRLETVQNNGKNRSYFEGKE